MKRILAIIILFQITINTVAQSNAKLIIKFKDGIDYQVNYSTKKILHSQLAPIPVLNNLISLSSMVNKNLPESNRLKKIELVENIHFITLPAGADIDVEILRLINTGLFEYVEKDEIGTGAGVNVTTPNDTYFASAQWSLKNLGVFSGTAVNDADIDMDNAWDITTGNANTIVCVLDAGFKLDHPELSGRIWQNPGEIPGNGLDDDGNGYIDDIQGWDWANNDNNPTDDHGHGTNVGSIIAAKGNNSAGIAGINWNCKLMIGKILNSSNSGFYSWWESGIYYAVNKGAKVINMSVGGSSFSSTMKNACDFAMANNVIIVACMHNQNTSVPYYPAAYSSVIAVGSTSDNDRRTVPFPWDAASGSNYGSHIDLVAPGNTIIGANNVNNTSYTYWAGTSQATPEVTGVVSLLLALKPNLTFAQAINIFSSTSQDMVGNPAEDVPGWDQYYGAGRLNAQAALNAVISILPIQFGEIAARRNSTGNELLWSTVSEYEIHDFTVEYSLDRTNWQAIRQVAATGNSTSAKYYSIQHVINGRSDAFYRIKVLNNDGSLNYSKIARVKKNENNYALNIDKIIADRTSINVYTTSDEVTACAFSLYSMDGKLVTRIERIINIGNTQFSWNTRLVPGVYQLKGITQNQKISAWVIIK